MPTPPLAEVAVESDCPSRSSSRMTQNASMSSICASDTQPTAHSPLLTVGSGLPILFAWVLFAALAITLYAMYVRRRTRRELEGGRCNLPTVVWRPRFFNYTTADEGESEKELSWDDDEAMMVWARNFLEEQRLDRTGDGIRADGRRKMGSSSITNILPRMERLNGPYGMYATVYGISTKVVHVAHPVPARAILTGAGAVDSDGVESERSSFSLTSALRATFKRNADQTDGPSKKHWQKLRRSVRRSSSMRMLTGSNKYPAYDHFKNFSGEGVFTADGADWKAKRASVVHCLIRGGNTDKSLEGEANRAADSFEREVAFASIAGGGKVPVINVVTMLQRSTIGLIYRLITHRNVDFGPDVGKKGGKERIGEEKVPSSGRERESTEGEPSSSDQTDSLTSSSSSNSLASMGEEGNEEARDEESRKGTTASSADVNVTTHRDGREEKIRSLLPTYLQSVTKIRMIVLAQSRSFWYLLPRWVYKAFSPMYREEERTMGPIREFAKLACESAAEGSPLALLSRRDSHAGNVMADANDAALRPGVPRNVSKDLLDEAITLLFAGQDTSAATLSWTLHLLSLHPEKQKRAAEEVRSVLMESRTADNEARAAATVVSKSMISRMPYLDAVIKESMRLYPVAPFVVRRLTADVTIPNEKGHPHNKGGDDGDGDDNNTNETISVPADTFACVWIYSLHRNPRLWSRPDDFLPERWIDPDLRGLDAGQREVGAYVPFAIGPRNCLGQPLAHSILRILLARILDRYEAADPRLEALQKLSETSDVKVDAKRLRKDMQAGFTVLPSDGLRLRLERRV